MSSERIKLSPRVPFALLALVGVFTLGSGKADASVITTDCADTTSCTFAELFDGGTIRVNDLVFFDWYGDAGGDFISPPDLAQMTVFGDDVDAFTSELHYAPGFQLDTEIDAFFDFGFSVLSLGRAIVDASLALDFPYFQGDEGDGGFVGILEEILGGADLSVYSDNLLSDSFLFDSASIGPAFSFDVFTSIDLFSDFAGELVGLDGFTQTFSVPEPGTLGLIAVGLLGLRATRRRQPA